jgi:hypothetical protein
MGPCMAGDRIVSHQLTSWVLRTLVGIANIGMPLAGWSSSAFASGYCPTCAAYAKHGHNTSQEPTPNKNGNTTNYTPIYPPTEPICIDQSRHPRPVSIRNITIKGVSYDYEYGDCSSTTTASGLVRAFGGATFHVVTQSPTNPNPNANLSCGALSWSDAPSISLARSVHFEDRSEWKILWQPFGSMLPAAVPPPR